jgi:hypothetical protein
MISFITMIDRQHSHRVVRSKEEMLEVVSKMYDLATKNGCTHFDLIVDTDVNCEKENQYA